jgi:hypothetical protein
MIRRVFGRSGADTPLLSEVRRMSELENFMAEYKEVCSNFRLLTDIRFKLLALLPIGTGAGIWVAGIEGPKVSTSLVWTIWFCRNGQRRNLQSAKRSALQ